MRIEHDAETININSKKKNIYFVMSRFVSLIIRFNSRFFYFFSAFFQFVFVNLPVPLRYTLPVSVSFHLNPYTNKRAQHSSTTRAVRIHSNRHSIHSVSEVTLRIDRNTGRHSTLFPPSLSLSLCLSSCHRMVFCCSTTRLIEGKFRVFRFLSHYY